ncbi:transcription factor-like protein [Tasmannia lanceolata]|uniref:transcription factor-like protein n=1 Tax=Tasmannia lanceolata TaxID=3420 RepID=UPI004064C881
MGFLLKEVLKSLCREIGWSYAVFWKIGYRNPSLLILEEGHYEPATGSGLLSIWNRPIDRFGQVSCQAEDGIGILVNKMMMQQVRVVGEGIVGRAALMENHLWTLCGTTHVDCGSMSEAQAEVHHQFLAGIQTIAIIPVLPHGVVQLGSTQMINENLGFVNHVKTLFLQLGSVPGTLLSDDIEKALGQKTKLPLPLGQPVSADQAKDFLADVARSTSFSGNIFDPQILRPPPSTLVTQPSGSLLSQIHSNSQSNASAMAKSHCDLFLPKAVPVVTPSLPLKFQSEAMGAQVIFSNPDAQLKWQMAPYISSSGNSQQPSVVRSGVPLTDLKFMQQQFLSSVGLREPVINNLPTSNNTKISLLSSRECRIPSSLKDSVIVSLLARNELPNIGNDIKTPSSNPSVACGSVDSKASYPPLESLGVQFDNSSDFGTLSVSNHSNYFNGSRHVPSEGSQPSRTTSVGNHTQTVRTNKQEKIQRGLFQAVDNPPALDSDEHSSWLGTTPGYLQDFLMRRGPKPDEDSQRFRKVISEENDSLIALCGEKNVEGSDDHKYLHRLSEKHSDALEGDLFDALGVDFKTKQHNGSLDDVLVHSADSNAENMSTDISTCITHLVSDPFFDGTNNCISESGIFSETGPDHLLDAVVSKINSSVKQRPDDNVSCKATLAKMSSSSICTVSSAYDWVAVSEQIRGEFGRSPDLVKPEMVGLGSFKTACALDKSGECSQANSTYKSQISLWSEDGHNMKCDSVSTGNPKRSDETGKVTRKRPKPGESSRPRPKDRQMIQDRVKELREIVPNGAKCSIDALLERTIKHMLFLQSVTKHADKLKQSGESKIMSKEGSSLLKDNFEGGATWAFEVGSQSMVCPIIVEDLNPPRQMLVEMLCEERGFFLEIADIIRGLGLTILKGVMEARNDTVWARFAVEANRDVTRMDIFMPLVHLLEQAIKRSRPPKGINTGNMGHNIFHQSSIPVTGLADNL